MKNNLDRNHHKSPGIPLLLAGLGSPAATPSGALVHREGVQLFEIPIAAAGSWVKDGRQFSITAKDHADMVRNFAKRKNHQLVIDYEHASEMPEVAKGGPIPAAGWIHNLRAPGDGKTQLWALVEWTPEAESMIRSGEYRFFSPAIDWGAADKATGEPQGATLTSGALTNHPFLEELPPIMLTDGTVLTGFAGARTPPAANFRRLGSSAGLAQPKGETSMKKLKLAHLETGGGQGASHAVIDPENEQPLGILDHDDLAQYAAQHLGVNPDAQSIAEGAAAAANKQAASGVARTATLLSQIVRNGKVNNLRASELAREGQITLSEYIQIQEAEKLLDAGVQAGKVLPRDRAFFFRDALERPAEFSAYLANAAPVVQFSAAGIGASDQVPVDEEIDRGVKRLMSERGLSYALAMKEFLKQDRGLERRYQTAHSARESSDALR